jgi:hypothetical protein
MSFNLGISSNPTSRLTGISSVGVYLYEDIYYRQWITEIALAFYEGRQDEFIWLDLVKQFRNPEKQQILPANLTREIIDEISILYQEEPIYQVVDENGKVLTKDQKLWEKIQKDSRYLSVMDRVDRWSWLLGTVLVKVSFIDEDTGQLVKATESGKIHLDVVHGGVYDIRHGASPYFISELLIGFGTKFGGFAHETGGMYGMSGMSTVASRIPSPSSYGASDALAAKYRSVAKPGQLGSTDRIYWSPKSHYMLDKDNNIYRTKNPYGIVPAVPFFNQDPAHYYFLPINEPLIYANHAVNMRITDLNHIAKFQSFGIPVVKGVERPTSTRQGRPVDDFNQLKGGTAQSRFGGIAGATGFGANGQFRTFDAGFGLSRDGNSEANALGFSLGPDTAIAVGEKGDFKFAHPSADITGLTNTIHSITDMVRINHGLRPKYDQDLPASGFAMTMDKIGVMQNNIRRSRLFKEREQQLFEVIKVLWNTHHNKSGQPKFNENARLEVTYKQPEFPVDPKTKKEDLIMEQKILDSGDTYAIKKLYPHLSDKEMAKMIKNRRKDREEEAMFQADVDVKVAKKFQAAGIDSASRESSASSGKDAGASTSSSSSINMKDTSTDKPKIDNRAKHSEESSKQPGKTNDPRVKRTKKDE